MHCFFLGEDRLCWAAAEWDERRAVTLLLALVLGVKASDGALGKESLGQSCLLERLLGAEHSAGAAALSFVSHPFHLT